MPEGKGYEGTFVPMEFQPQNSEGVAVAVSQQTETGVGMEDIDALRDSSLNAKKTNPFGPCWPGLEEYFRGGM